MEEISFDQILLESGSKYQIERNGVIINEVLGKPYKADIRLSMQTKVERGDILIDSYGERHKVKDSHITYLKGKPRRTTVVIEQQPTPTKQVQYNINGQITNASIGEYATTNVYNEIDIERLKTQVEELGGDDKSELREIIAILEDIRSNATAVKGGMLSRFSNVLEKHSWITGSIASAVMSWLINRRVYRKLCKPLLSDKINNGGFSYGKERKESHETADRGTRDQGCRRRTGAGEGINCRTDPGMHGRGTGRRPRIQQV